MDVRNFSIELLAGQRLMVGFEGKDINPEIRHLVQDLKVGGVIYFARNLDSPGQIKSLSASLQELARAAGHPPLLIAVDQEGGEVARLKKPFTLFKGNPFMQTEADAVRFAEITAEELTGVGINMNMAPVVDVAPKDMDSIMAGRSFGDDPRWVSRLGIAVIQQFQSRHIMAVAKHFPGIGRTIIDSHLEMPTLDDDLPGLENFDLIPFDAAVQNEVSGIMLSHIFYPRLDAEWPASLSRKIAADLLRNKIGFNGVVLTDDLEMGAIEKRYEIETAIRCILSADIDIALICRTLSKIETAHEKICKCLAESGEMMQKGVESIERIMKLKKSYLSF